MVGRIAIENVWPVVGGGELAAKATVDAPVTVSATVYREGHEAVGCAVVLRAPDGSAAPPVRMTPAGEGTDRWEAVVRPDTVGAWTFEVEAFGDPYLTWRHTVTARLAAGDPELDNDLQEGAALLVAAAATVPPQRRPAVLRAAAALRDDELAVAARVGPALRLAPLLWDHPVRELVTGAGPLPLWVDRTRAEFSAWYEFFPRSEGGVAADGTPVHGTLRTAAARLPAVAAMGFDVVYLPPIHPIGRVNRKGRDNGLLAGPDDVGSPWAIGAEEGGHDAIHPDLGDHDDFRAFVQAARRLGMEVAMDLALQCAPDHPWVKEHPGWFRVRADGSVAYAENPPKRYQDIYPLDFDADPDGLRAEVLRVVTHWVEQGVRVFRVDNPHTKPVDFWQWLIGRVRQGFPDVLFLAEAFTRPAMMHGLARLGFTQSYTYFTWRSTPAELRAYCEELVAAAHYMRPNFWPNTPDILPVELQRGNPAAFKIRAVLAALLAASWGVYSGYELCEHLARPGTEEYLGSEKYELRARDWDGAHLGPFLARLNTVRREHPALHRFANLVFHEVDNERMLVWSKRDEDSGDTIVVVCSFDPDDEQWANVTLDLPALGLDPGERFIVADALTGAEFEWDGHPVIRLAPWEEPAHVLIVRPPIS